LPHNCTCSAIGSQPADAQDGLERRLRWEQTSAPAGNCMARAETTRSDTDNMCRTGLGKDAQGINTALSVDVTKPGMGNIVAGSAPTPVLLLKVLHGHVFAIYYPVVSSEHAVCCRTWLGLGKWMLTSSPRRQRSVVNTGLCPTAWCLNVLVAVSLTMRLCARLFTLRTLSQHSEVGC
jgi:hypothetical protein